MPFQICLHSGPPVEAFHEGIAPRTIGPEQITDQADQADQGECDECGG
jgi:hypothetical protein